MLRKPPPLLLPVRARVYSCACTHSYTLTRACARSPVLRKSKIAVSLNSFPLAARTAFVLQTKRKRNETEGSEEAGRRRETGSQRPRSKQRKRETGRESRKRGKRARLRKREDSYSTLAERQTGELGKEVLPSPKLSARTQVSQTSPQPQRHKTRDPLPHQSPPERAAPDGHKAWGRGNHVSQQTGPRQGQALSPRHCHLAPFPNPFCQSLLLMLAQHHLLQEAIPTVLHLLWEPSA